jgi:hypothetical protein
MSTYPFKELEAAAVNRNPLLADRLRPGLLQKDIHTALERAKVKGAAKVVTELYSWKNGTLWDQQLALSKTGLFPGASYNLSDLKRAIVDTGSLKVYWKEFPKLRPLARRYFPAFWDGADSHLALDLESNESAVVLVRLFVKDASLIDGHYEPEIRETEPPRQVYSSFGEFIADVIRANRDNTPLRCLQTT